MAITNGLCTLAEIKAELGISDSTDDTRLEQVVEAVSRLIDDYCGFPRRHFYQTSAGAVRYFTADDAKCLYIDDVTTVTEVALDRSGDGTWEQTLTVTTDYVLAPYNAAGISRPYTSVEIVTSSGKTFPVGATRGVKVTGTWGWPAVPEQAKQACLIQSERVFKRSEAPFGIASLPSLDGAGMRLQAKLDPDVELMLHSLRRRPVGIF